MVRTCWREIVPLPVRTRRNIGALLPFHGQRRREMDVIGTPRPPADLIGSDKVEGTAVFGADREKIGIIERLMIEKETGQVAFAVLRFGGILGFGDEHFPLPWQALTYDPTLGGYRTNVSEAQLREAPRFGGSDTWDWTETQRSRALDSHYGLGDREG